MHQTNYQQICTPKNLGKGVLEEMALLLFSWDRNTHCHHGAELIGDNDMVVIIAHIYQGQMCYFYQ